MEAEAEEEEEVEEEAEEELEPRMQAPTLWIFAAERKGPGRRGQEERGRG